MTARSQKHTSSCRVSTVSRSAPLRSSPPTACASSDGSCTVSASVKRRIAPRATRAPWVQAQAFPYQPSGSGSPRTSRTRSSGRGVTLPRVPPCRRSSDRRRRESPPGDTWSCGDSSSNRSDRARLVPRRDDDADQRARWPRVRPRAADVFGRETGGRRTEASHGSASGSIGNAIRAISVAPAEATTWPSALADRLEVAREVGRIDRGCAVAAAAVARDQGVDQRVRVADDRHGDAAIDQPIEAKQQRHALAGPAARRSTARGSGSAPRGDTAFLPRLRPPRARAPRRCDRSARSPGPR